MFCLVKIIISIFFNLIIVISLSTAYEYCEYELIHPSMLSASSSLVTREADKALLWAPTAWTVKHSDYSQHILIDLGVTKNVTKIATQGREDSSEYVSAYTISYSLDRKLFSHVKGPDGRLWAFQGNLDGNTIHENVFRTPIIARYIRVNPTRWGDRISMRLELYGCEYERESLDFDGNAMIEIDYKHSPIASTRDQMRFRFRTAQPDAILIYARGTQGDFMALQLKQNRMLLNINLGSKITSSLMVGSLLDDNSWHDVEIIRNQQNASLYVDRVRIDNEILGDFKRFDLDRQMYIGGVPNIQKGLDVRVNFTGCIENMFINESAVIPDIKRGRPYYDYYPTFTNHRVQYECRYTYSSDQTITFLNRESHLQYEADPDQNALGVSLNFRTYEEEGLLLYHRFVSEGFFAIYLERGKVKVDVSAKHTPGTVILDNFITPFNDGRWHQVDFSIKKDYMLLKVDEVPMETTRLIDVTSGRFFYIAGHPSLRKYRGFVGCMRLISVKGFVQSPKPEEIKHPKGVILAACQLFDKCDPNPCEHGGKCKQTSLEFTCDCTGTGYSGAVCHTSLNPVSCAAFQKYRVPGVNKVDIFVDIDGSGPLEPFPVVCEYYNSGQLFSHLEHKHEMPIRVSGYESPGSYIQDINYNAGWDQIEIFVNRSTRCRQRLQMNCLQATLFNTPVEKNAEFLPNSWWVSRLNQPMDYWGGSLPGSRKCECGVLSSCVFEDKWCNCDSGMKTVLSDGGDLTVKQHLPVRQMRIGGTGSPLEIGKYVEYFVGPLICEGDDIFENVITFRKADASIALPRFDMGHSGDFYLEFKTTAAHGCLVHATGPEDYIKLCLVGELVLQFQYAAGSGPLGVTIETASPLNDNEWHSVLVERNRKEAVMIVDGSKKSSVREPPGPVRALQLTSEFFIGSTQDYRDGYVGCVRAVMLNGELQDLRSQAERGLYGVAEGCVGKCQSSPCLNNGTCHEGYSSYACECRWTAFKGPICADEIGIKMLTDTMVKYEVPGNYKSTIAEKIRVGFTTTNPRGFLIGLYSNVTGEYLTLAVSNSGHLKLTFDFGFERHEVVYRNRTFHEGQNHDVRVERFDNGQRIKMTVDNYEPVVWYFPVKASHDAQFNNIQYVYVGKNETMAEGFIGCISRVEFDDIYPLKFYFQQDRLSNVKAVSTSKIAEDYCGIEPLRYPEEEIETRPPVEVPEEVVASLYSNEAAILGAVLAVICIALILMGFMIGRYLARHKGAYQTHEDEGADLAPDADEAVQNSRTGHRVKKNVEMYI